MIDFNKMFRKKVLTTLFAVLFGGVFCSAKLSAQQPDSVWYDIEYIRLSDARLTNANASGLKYLPVNNVSTAALYTTKNNGKFINYYQSDNSFDAGADVESYYRLNPKTVFYGKINYDYFKGRNMGGSYFLRPSYNPIDIQQSSDSTNGNKVKETYHLIGALSTDITSRLTLGGKVDYEVGNYSKQKDLRNVNKFLDLVVTIGGSYKLTKNIEIGANYYFNRNVESLQFQTNGNNDKKYESIISIGNFIGIKEQFGESGNYTAKSKILPMINKYNGGYLQLYVALSQQLSIFNNFGYKSRTGYYGKRSSADIVLTEHTSNIFEYEGNLSFKGDRYQHLLTVNVAYENLDNKRNIYDSKKEDGQQSVVIYQGQLDILTKKELNTSVQYHGFFDIVDYNPKWELNAGFDYYRRQQKASLVPFYRKQTVNSYSFNIGGKRNFKMDAKSMLGVSLSMSYRKGSGTPMYDGLYMNPSSSQVNEYKTNDEYLYQEYEYLTVPQFTGGISLRYSRAFVKEVKNYIQIDYAYTKASNSDLHYIRGDHFNTVGLAIGCTF